MLDSQLNEVKVYSADGEYLNTLGREGEGRASSVVPKICSFFPTEIWAYCSWLRVVS